MTTPHEHFVRVSTEMVDQLIANPSDPVTLRIEEREDGELHLTATKHECARMEKQQSIFGLPVVDPERN
jgi:hypothetical protein